MYDYNMNNNYVPESKVHGANMGPTWVLSTPDGPMLAPWTLLSSTAGGYPRYVLFSDKSFDLQIKQTRELWFMVNYLTTSAFYAVSCYSLHRYNKSQ